MVLKSDPEGSSIERAFLYYWRCLELEGSDPKPKPIPQFKVGRWILDFAFPDQKIGIELDGGRGGGFGRPVVCHRCGAKVRARKKSGEIGKEIRLPYPSHSGAKQERDLRKNNDLVIQGWRILRFSSQQIYSDPTEMISQILLSLSG